VANPLHLLQLSGGPWLLPQRYKNS
jgi:hypothetical protein